VIDIKILFVTNSSHSCFGYGVVARNVVKRLRKHGYDVMIAGMQTLGDAIPDSEGNINLPIRFHLLGLDSIERYLSTGEFDVVIGMFDIWVSDWSNIVPTVKKFNLPYIHHTTILSYPLSPYIRIAIQHCDYIVVPSKWNLIPLREAGLDFKSFWISHGVDIEKYKPLKESEKEKIKKELGLEDKFIFLNVCRNKGYGKNFHGIMNAYRLFLQKNPDAIEHTRLLLLTDPEEPEQGNVNLLHLREMLGLQNNVIFVKGKFDPDNPGRLIITSENDPCGFYHFANYRFDEIELRKLYGIADCFVLLSMNESFSLPTLEAQAMKLPCIVPGWEYHGAAEQIRESGAGLFVRIARLELTPLISYVCVPDEQDAALKMEEIYRNEELRKELGEKGRKFAETRTWDKVVEEGWIPLLKKVENDLLTCDYLTGRLGL